MLFFSLNKKGGPALLRETTFSCDVSKYKSTLLRLEIPSMLFAYGWKHK